MFPPLLPLRLSFYLFMLFQELFVQYFFLLHETTPLISEKKIDCYGPLI